MNEESYYQCTKNKKILKIELLDCILSYFKKFNEFETGFDTIYEYLQYTLQIKSIGRENLAKFLNTTTYKGVVNCLDINDKLNNERQLIKGNDLKDNVVPTISKEIDYDEFNVMDLDKRVVSSNELLRIQNAINKINPENNKIRLSYYFDENLISIFLDKNKHYVKDLVNDDALIMELYQSEFYDKYVSTIEYMQIDAPREFVHNFMNVLKLANKKGKENKFWEKYVEIIGKRAAGATLQAAGEEYEVTRERVRQIECKYISKFNAFDIDNKKGIYDFLSAYSKNESYIEISEIETLIGKYSNLFIYFLKNYESDQMQYIEECDVFAFNTIFNWYEYLLDEIDRLDSTITDIKSVDIINDTCKLLKLRDVVIPFDIVKGILLNDYKLNGTIYSKDNLSLGQRYKMVCEKFFKDGINVYQDSDIRQFKSKYKEMFNDDIDGQSNRAIESRISAVTILCDKGKYKPFNGELISNELLNDICDYIDNSDKEVFLTNTLFAEFEDRLISENILNKYSLQGILHHECPDKYFYSRDYVSKNSKSTSIYNEVIDYIKRDGWYVTKEQLQQEFPSVPNQVLYTGLQESDIIICFGRYVSKQSVLAKQQELMILKNYALLLTIDGEIHSCDELFNKMVAEVPSIVDALGIKCQFDMFSILNVTANDVLSMNRPYIAKIGIEINK